MKKFTERWKVKKRVKDFKKKIKSQKKVKNFKKKVREIKSNKDRVIRLLKIVGISIGYFI